MLRPVLQPLLGIYAECNALSPVEPRHYNQHTSEDNTFQTPLPATDMPNPVSSHLTHASPQVLACQSQHLRDFIKNIQADNTYNAHWRRKPKLLRFNPGLISSVISPSILHLSEAYLDSKSFEFWLIS